jgi:trigger factor
MVDKEVDGEIQELNQRLQAQGMELDMYLEMQEMTMDDLREQIRPQAETRIERGLIIGEIADSEELDISPEEITAEYQQIINQHFGDEDSEERTQFMSSPDSMQLLNRVSSQMISQKAVSYLIALARGEDVSEFLKQEESDPDPEDPEDSEGSELESQDEEVAEQPTEEETSQEVELDDKETSGETETE